MNLTIYRCFISLLCFNLISLTSINAESINASHEMVAVNKSIYRLISVKKKETQQLATQEDVVVAAQALGVSVTKYLESNTDITNNMNKLELFFTSVKNKIDQSKVKLNLQFTPQESKDFSKFVYTEMIEKVEQQKNGDGIVMNVVAGVLVGVAFAFVTTAFSTKGLHYGGGSLVPYGKVYITIASVLGFFAGDYFADGDIRLRLYGLFDGIAGNLSERVETALDLD